MRKAARVLGGKLFKGALDYRVGKLSFCPGNPCLMAKSKLLWDLFILIFCLSADVCYSLELCPHLSVLVEISSQNEVFLYLVKSANIYNLPPPFYCRTFYLCSSGFPT